MRVERFLSALITRNVLAVEMSKLYCFNAKNNFSISDPKGLTSLLRIRRIKLTVSDFILKYPKTIQQSY